MDGKMLKRFRLFLGLTCEEAGKMCYLTKQTVSNVETGKTKTKSTMLLLEYSYRNYMRVHKDEFYNKLEEERIELNNRADFLKNVEV